VSLLAVLFGWAEKQHVTEAHGNSGNNTENDIDGHGVRQELGSAQLSLVEYGSHPIASI